MISIVDGLVDHGTHRRRGLPEHESYTAGRRAATIAFLALLLLSPSPALSQPEAEAAADSLVRNDSALFEPPLPDPRRIGGPEGLHREPLPYYRAVPEFSARYDHVDLLGLSDRLFIVGYDRADGLYLGLGADLGVEHFFERRLQGHFGFGYAVGSHYWQVAGGLSRDFFSEERPLRLGFEAHIVTDTRDAWKMGPIENSLFAAMAGVDTRDYFQRRGYSGTAMLYLDPRTTVSFAVHRDAYRSSRLEVEWSLLHPHDAFAEVPAITAKSFTTLSLTLVADYMSLRSRWDGQAALAARFEAGVDATKFTSLVIDARAKVQVIPRLASIAVHARAASVSVGAPRQWHSSIGGFGSLPGFPQNAYVGEKMVLVQTDILLQPLRQVRGLRLIFSNDAGWVGSGEGVSLFDGIPARLYSTGVYLGSSEGRFRIGAAWRTDIGQAVFIVRLASRF